ncbi:potassium channel family protein [Candidatus Binatus sp.]|uniref:potassium channel family protein n=1 Tax=Candidatus Binatus sp. TaxID=2811406 RepID=UPI003C71FB40
MTATRRFALAISLVAAMTVVGAIGYILIEHMSVLDAFYMSVITISTVGFQEVKPLSPAGRLFTIGLIVTGVGSAIYLFTVIGELVVEGRLREFLGKSAMTRKIHSLEQHVIVCGFGRFGRAVVEELIRNAVAMVVIEADPAKQADLDTVGALHVAGSALEDSVLEDAGIGSARAIIVATGSDADNVYITLSAREKNPKILIYARGDSEAGLRRLKLAGADQVVAAYQWAGMRIAASILRPSVVDFLQLSVPGRESEVDLEEIRISRESPAAGKTIAALERENPRLRVVALKRNDQRLEMIPAAETKIEPDDLLVAIGEADSLKRLASA